MLGQVDPANGALLQFTDAFGSSTSGDEAAFVFHLLSVSQFDDVAVGLQLNDRVISKEADTAIFRLGQSINMDIKVITKPIR